MGRLRESVELIFLSIPYIERSSGEDIWYPRGKIENWVGDVSCLDNQLRSNGLSNIENHSLCHKSRTY